MTKVSVIVPVYNAYPFLDRCVKSIQNQSLQDITILLIDDGSTDGSSELCNSCALGNKRILPYVLFQQSIYNNGIFW
ncbi:MAG: glycosyltransferase family 2 protein [Bacteroides thetaiotaomicron]